ncbi:hypothetical protein EIN_063190 [Entamoeba invadens IP1]|uniref:hypothetical protein n=1 Tax=Entamoeba invadens IP1 TaxID=370355 RepID=UPI0002C3E52E|nr:hypothetical protein EIN_063190 [Entamoeba invadens IP1]ELP93594.1 hypothetical protein EIN_063190 [Entamoeba invadens IP1]|eukprot:XP_004260365.1 hypothetical protein EIN_063190 [Entamoeba invadens IP1]
MKLEAFYLINVTLYLETMKDVITFLLINKKCYEVVQHLQVNPWLNNAIDIELFYTLFAPFTLNCNNFPIDVIYIEKAQCIRNLCIAQSASNSMLKKISPILFSKFRNFDIELNTTEIVRNVLENVSHNYNLICSPSVFTIFVEMFKEKKLPKEVFPNKVCIEFIKAPNFGMEKSIFDTKDALIDEEEIVKIIDNSAVDFHTKIVCDWTACNYYTKYTSKMQHCGHYMGSVVNVGEYKKIKLVKPNNGIIFNISEHNSFQSLNSDKICLELLQLCSACLVPKVTFRMMYNSIRFVWNTPILILEKIILLM